MKLLLTLLIVIIPLMACDYILEERAALASGSAHSQLPWKVVPNGVAFNLESNKEFGGVEFPAKHFCILLGMTYQPEGQHEANVNFIVATANAMPEIRGFLSELIDRDFDHDTTAKAVAILEKLDKAGIALPQNQFALVKEPK